LVLVAVSFNGGFPLWLELKLAAKLLPQLTRRSMVLIFTLKSVLRAAAWAGLVDLLLTATWLVLPAQRAAVLAAAPKRLKPNLDFWLPIAKKPSYEGFFVRMFAYLYSNISTPGT
jgi:hypothetical protein